MSTQQTGMMRKRVTPAALLDPVFSAIKKEPPRRGGGFDEGIGSRPVFMDRPHVVCNSDSSGVYNSDATAACNSYHIAAYSSYRIAAYNNDTNAACSN